MLIGISGKAGSGKDLSANYLIQLIDGNRPMSPNKVIRVKKFAGKLKEIICVLTGCSKANLEDETFKSSELPPEWNRSMKDAREWIVMKSWNRGLQSPQLDITLDDNEIKSIANELGFKFERTYRELMQEIGTELFRNQFLDNVWVNALFADYTPLRKNLTFANWGKERGTLESSSETVMPRWIITDVRFPNEANAIKERGGLLLRINRFPKTLMRSRTGGSEPEEIKFDPDNKSHLELYHGEMSRAHSSETALDKYTGFDAVIDNNGTTGDLYKNLSDIVNKFKLR